MFAEAAVYITVGAAEVVTGYVAFFLHHLRYNGKSYNESAAYTQDKVLVSLYGCAWYVVNGGVAGAFDNIAVCSNGVGDGAEFSQRGAGAEKVGLGADRIVAEICTIYALKVLGFFARTDNADCRNGNQH